MTTKSTASPAAEVKPKKKSTTQIVIDEKMLPQLVSGSVWKRVEGETDEAYLARLIYVQTTLVKFIKNFKTACKMFDKELSNIRNIQGSDHLEGLNWFRKPRQPKQGEDDSSLLDEFAFGDEDDD